MADEFFIGDDFDQMKVTVYVDGSATPFNGGTVRWWLSTSRTGATAFTPKTVADTSPSNFTAAYYYPVLTAVETAALTAGDYWVVTEITLGGKIRTFIDQRITFSARGNA